MHKFIFMSLGLFEPAEDAKPGASGGADTVPTVAEATAAIENKSMPITQRLDVAYKALKGVNIDAQLKDVKGELATAKTDLTAANTKVKDLEAKVTDLQAKITAFEASTAQLEKENKDLAAKEQDLEKRAEAKTKERMKALGFPANQLPPAQDGTKVQEGGSKGLLEKFQKETNSEKKAALYQDYKAALAKEEAAAKT